MVYKKALGCTLELIKNGKIINADTGKFYEMSKESDNHFKSGSYHYLTNDRKSVVVEIRFNSVTEHDLVFSKILMCEPF